MMTLRLTCILLLTSLSLPAADHHFHHENVLGTTLELSVVGSSRSNAEGAERVALAEIQRLSSILSSYDSNSELAQFVALPVGARMVVSPELFELFRTSDQWRNVSQGAFNSGTQELSKLWGSAAEAGHMPTSAALRSALAVVRQQHWELDRTSRTVARRSEAAISLNAIAKGFILDRVAEAVLDSPGVTGVVLNIGGDIRVLGSAGSAVSVAHPEDDAIGGKPLVEIAVIDGAVATSGHSERGFDIQGKRYSHIIDPRSGWPVQNTLSATILASNATNADALATICSVLSVRDSLALVNSLPQVECLLVARTGIISASNGWPQEKKSPQKGTGKTGPKKNQTRKKPEPTGHEMLVEFEIARPRNARRYRRPYVAVWVEDKDKFPVKTLSLFLMQNNPGPRWYRDVRRWYADEQIRKLTDDKDLIKTVSKPTRNPGKYKVAWDGRDDDGKVLKPGKYTLLIEAAREHGTYQLIKREFEFGKGLKKTKLKGNTEISAASVTYTVKPVKKGKAKQPSKGK